MKTALISGAALTLAMAAPAAAQSFTSTFENVVGGPGAGAYSLVTTADGWTAGSGMFIELQNNVAGAPAPTGGNVFVELDSNANSSMSRVINDAGTYSLSFLYSPRPNVGSGSNGIEVLLNNVLLNPPGTVTGGPFGATSWSTISTGAFDVTAGSILTFRAVGTSDSLGGYVDNITLSAVPEPATWAMMIGGFGIVGGTLRRRRAKLRFAAA